LADSETQFGLFCFCGHGNTAPESNQSYHMTCCRLVLHLQTSELRSIQVAIMLC